MPRCSQRAGSPASSSTWRQKGDHVVAGPLLVLEDARGVELAGRLGLHGRGGPGRDAAGRLHRLAGGQLDPQPGVVAVAVGPKLGQRGTRVAGDHWRPLLAKSRAAVQGRSTVEPVVLRPSDRGGPAPRRAARRSAQCRSAPPPRPTEIEQPPGRLHQLLARRQVVGHRGAREEERPWRPSAPDRSPARRRTTDRTAPASRASPGSRATGELSPCRRSRTPPARPAPPVSSLTRSTKFSLWVSMTSSQPFWRARSDLVGPTGGSDDLEADGLRPLAGDASDAARCGVEEDGVAARGAHAAEQEKFGGHPLEHHGGRRAVVDPRRQPHQAIGRDDPRLGVGAAHPRVGDTVTDGEIGDPRTDGVDDAGSLLSRRERQAGRLVEPRPEIDVDEVEADRRLADTRLAGGRRLIGDGPRNRACPALPSRG